MQNGDSSCYDSEGRFLPQLVSFMSASFRELGCINPKKIKPRTPNTTALSAPDEVLGTGERESGAPRARSHHLWGGLLSEQEGNRTPAPLYVPFGPHGLCEATVSQVFVHRSQKGEAGVFLTPLSTQHHTQPTRNLHARHRDLAPRHVAASPPQVQIGCHTDDLSKASKLSRAPVVTHRCCMDRTKQSVSCLWGGLLYVIVPKGSELGPVPVTIKRAVPAPYYKLGKC